MCNKDSTRGSPIDKYVITCPSQFFPEFYKNGTVPSGHVALGQDLFTLTEFKRNP
jgi:hypothetical protein